MPAVMRGGSYGSSRPRPKAQKTLKPARPRPASRARGASAPAKLHAAQSLGLKPGAALGVAACVAVIGLVVALSTGGRLPRLTANVGQVVGDDLAPLGFQVQRVHVEGATPMARADVLKAAGLTRGDPILGLDLNALRGRVEQVGWVRSAKVVRLLPDTLIVSITQRQPAAVWQDNRKSMVVDDTGRVIPEADAGRFTDLPLVVGTGANEALDDILPLVRARPQLMQRLEALVRVDDRRWDIRLKDGGIIALPALHADSALIQLDRLEQTQQILSLGLERIDLRDPDAISVRPRADAAAIAARAAAAQPAQPDQETSKPA